MNTVFTKIAGQNEPLLVLHGWGMNHRVWSTVSTALEHSFRVIWMDLPGHGKSKAIDLGQLDDIVDQVMLALKQINEIKKPVNVLGWSLGGLIAQRLAERFPDQVNSLVLVATSPSFLQRDNWPHAMPEKILHSFMESLNDDYQATIQRFLALQFMGVKGGKEVKASIKRLREEVLANLPNHSALSGGLDILCQTDLRTVSLSSPTCWILGSLDKLIPVAVADELATKKDVVHIMDGAGHAPFISHPEDFVTYVTQCLTKRGDSE